MIDPSSATDEDKCEGLWHAVMRQAISDASRVDELAAAVERLKIKLNLAQTESETRRVGNLLEINKRELNECRRSWAWLFEDNEDFDEVCSVLNVEPYRMRKMASGVLTTYKPRGRMMIERATELF